MRKFSNPVCSLLFNNFVSNFNIHQSTISLCVIFFYHNAIISPAVVPVLKTCTTFTGKNCPAYAPTNVNISPPAVWTFTAPAEPIYKAHPLFIPSGLDMLGIKAVSLGVTGAALLAVSFVSRRFGSTGWGWVRRRLLHCCDECRELSLTSVLALWNCLWTWTESTYWESVFSNMSHLFRCLGETFGWNQ